MQIFPFDELPGGNFSKIIGGFMYGVLGLVVVMIIYKQIKIKLGERKRELVTNNILINGLTLLISALVLYCGYFIGTNYLGNEMGLNFMLKWGGAILSVFILIIPYNLIKKVESGFINNYKDIFIATALRSIDSAISYSKDKFIGQDEFTDSKLFTFQNIYTFNGSDLFAGSVQNFHGSSLKVQQKEVHKSSGKTEVKISEVFNGYLFVADFNKLFSGETYIFPDVSRNILGEVYGEFMNEYIHRGKIKLVKMEDVNFEKMFTVYSSDELTARYILSPKLIERINEFKNNFYQDILFSFVNNKLFVAIKTDSELFKPVIFGKLDDYNYLQKQYNYLYALLTLPEQFDLKTKIWN
ncbi:MAG: DUF3137 domain-containing protein [Fimbriimonadaceae bacterium]|nr:DUF3137 domain-containing protein [Chitinophagales bacterium]